VSNGIEAKPLFLLPKLNQVQRNTVIHWCSNCAWRRSGALF